MSDDDIKIGTGLYLRDFVANLTDKDLALAYTIVVSEEDWRKACQRTKRDPRSGAKLPPTPKASERSEA